MAPTAEAVGFTLAPRRLASATRFILVVLLLIVARGFAQDAPRLDSQQWRILNAEEVASNWAIVEVEFHDKPSCDSLRREAPLFSSYVQNSPSGTHAPSYAFDGIVATGSQGLTLSWWADCGVGPCRAMSQYIGQDYVESTYDIKCVRILQSEMPGHFSRTLALQKWNGSNWQPVSMFRNTYGGFFMMLPVPALAKWRVLPLQALRSGWRVLELSIHLDVECTIPMGGRSSAIGEVGDGTVVTNSANPSSAAVDGNPDSSWAAPCTSQAGGCAALGAWLEVSAAQPGQMPCLRLLQADAAGAASVLVQAWDGSDYFNATSFMDLTPGSWDHLVRWEAANARGSTLWRLVPQEAPYTHWRVYELELFTDLACTLGVVDPIAMASGAFGPARPNVLSDDDVTKAWAAPLAVAKASSGWRSLNASIFTTTHYLGYPWIGLSITAGQPVRCVRLLQSNVQEDTVAALTVQAWDGTAWSNYVANDRVYGRVTLSFAGLSDVPIRRGPVSWQRLPAVDRVQWRISQLDIIFTHWAVKEVHFYETADCRNEVTGLPIGSAEDPLLLSGNPARNAFDNNLATEWWSSCSECVAGEAWIGVATPTPRNVRCVAIFQSGVPPGGGPQVWYTSGVNLDKWNGHQWVQAARYTGLSKGAWDRLQLWRHVLGPQDAPANLSGWSTQDDTVWRVSVQDTVVNRWAVAELVFYTDFDCRANITDGSPVTSGDVIDFEMTKGFDVDPTTEWRSSCETCQPGQAWLGLVFPQPREVRCVRILQNLRPYLGSSSVAVGRYTSDSWTIALLAKGVQPSAVENLLVIQPGGDLGDARARWRIVNQAPVVDTWRIAGARFFTRSGCLNQAAGIRISSGYTRGNPPDNAFDASNEDTFWESSCRGCTAGQAWIGLSMDGKSPPLRCAQLRQARDPAHGSLRISVQMLRADGWVEAVRFDYANLGAWDHFHINALPTAIASQAQAIPARSMWRLVNAAPVARTWVVKQLTLYTQANATGCVNPVPGLMVASGEADGFPPENAGSGAGQAPWAAPCIECAAGGAWLGALLSAPANVTCVEVEQSEDAMDATLAASLEVWDGSSWRSAGTYSGLSGGIKLPLTPDWASPADYQQFRVAALDDVQSGWGVAELRFFAGMECAMEVQGFPIASSYSGPAMPKFAFDRDPSTMWEVGGVPPISAADAWMGAHFSNPQDVKCIVIRQSDELGMWLPGIALETIRSSVWERIAVLTNLSPGGWFALFTFRAAASAVNVNFQDTRTGPPRGYVGDYGNRYAFHPGNNLTYGWNCDLASGAYNRDYSADLVTNTGVMTAGCFPAIWQLSVLAGRYYVVVVYSNPGFGVNTSGCTVEGVQASAGRVGIYEQAQVQVNVDVVDANVTFSGSSPSCQSIAAIQVSAMPGMQTMWRLATRTQVSNRWRLHELQLYEADTCAGTALSAETMFASGWAEGSSPWFASDGRVETVWASACTACNSSEAWVAASFTSLQTVQCIRLWQSVEGDSQSDSVALEHWNGTNWIVDEVFQKTVGGLWGQYNSRWVHPPPGHRWRLSLPNRTKLTGPLRIAEAAFFSDVGCNASVMGSTIAAPSAFANPAGLAFDGDISTWWQSACAPCGPGEAWLGLHFDSPVDVRCIAAVLGAVDGRRLTAGAATVQIPLRLEAWGGQNWTDSGVDLETLPGARVFARRLQGLASITPGTAWRLVNAANTTAPWAIQEIEFYLQTQCQDQVEGTPMASSERPGAPSYLAFDGNNAYTSSWVAGCPKSGCQAETQWIGNIFAESQAFQCVRIYQASRTLSGDPSAHVIRMERWGDSGGWEAVRTFGITEAVPSGRWAVLQVLTDSEKFALKATEWRFVADDAIRSNWAVAEIGFYEDVECQTELLGTVAASGEAGNRFVTAAVDGRADTFWWSQASPASRAAWIGLALGDAHVVRCVQLLQGLDRAYSTSAVELQSRPEEDWLHVKSFTNAVGGDWQNFQVFEGAVDKPAGSMWRVSNYDDIAQTWVLIELELYSDSTCTRFESGRVLSPGFVSGQDPSLAFDTQLGTAWEPPCSPCQRGQAWLGQSFYGYGAASSTPRVVEVKCMALLQGAGKANTSQSAATSTSTVTVERWDGAAFRRAGRFSGVVAGEFVKLLLGVEEVVVDWGRRASLEAAANEPPDDPQARRQRLQAAGLDAVQFQVSLLVDSWPGELVADLAAISKFKDAFALSVRAACASTTREPQSAIFADNVQLGSGTPGAAAGSEAALSSIVATVTVYVSRNSSGGAYQTDPNVVLRGLKDIADDPYNTQALFLRDGVRLELRKATRLDPQLSSVVAQVDGQIRLRLASPTLILAVQSTTTPPPTAGGRTSTFSKDKSYWTYAIIIAAVAVAVPCVSGTWYCYFRQRRLRDEQAAWEVAHPGVPFPRRRTCLERWFLCPNACPCCKRFASPLLELRQDDPTIVAMRATTSRKSMAARQSVVARASMAARESNRKNPAVSRVMSTAVTAVRSTAPARPQPPPGGSRKV